ncbi:MAG: hypothetical protein C0482_29585 [Gordonia sp.]|nr:hypothetical protein [Gordonia sp. (in: high G+C Gram-positive bacteria)]
MVTTTFGDNLNVAKEKKNKEAEEVVLRGVIVVAIVATSALATLAITAVCQDWRNFWPNAGQPFATILGGLAVLGGGTLALYNGRKARAHDRELADEENTRVRELADEENTRVRELADAEHERQTTIANAQQAHETVKELNARFTTAAAQLGHKDSVAIRQAGAHALAALADDWSRQGDLHQRQVCIDVLCGYLAVHQPVGPRPTFAGTPAVTKTIQHIVAQHTQMAWKREGAPEPAHQNSWCHATFNFENAQFIDLDLRNCLFTGDVNFAKAEFHGDNTLFAETRFTGPRVSFKEAKFHADQTYFSHVKFAATLTDFRGTEFRSPESTDFAAAEFNDTSARFTGAIFASKETTFNGAAFDSPAYIYFSESTFHNSLIFSNANIKQGYVSFVGTRFDVDRADFSQLSIDEGAKINFAGPKTWVPANMTFDWNAADPEDIPEGVSPRSWPPQEKT